MIAPPKYTLNDVPDTLIYGFQDGEPSLFQHRLRRCAIEPKLNHLKSDHRMARCFQAGLCGDASNAVLATAGANFRKLLGLIGRQAGRFVYATIRWIERLAASCRSHRLTDPVPA